MCVLGNVCALKWGGSAGVNVHIILPTYAWIWGVQCAHKLVVFAGHGMRGDSPPPHLPPISLIETHARTCPLIKKTHKLWAREFAYCIFAQIAIIISLAIRPKRAATRQAYFMGFVYILRPLNATPQLPNNAYVHTCRGISMHNEARYVCVIGQANVKPIRRPMRKPSAAPRNPV